MSGQPKGETWNVIDLCGERGYTIAQELARGHWIDEETGVGFAGGSEFRKQKLIAVTFDRDAESMKHARLLAAAPQMYEALSAILREPFGCAFCDSGTLRNATKSHDADCGYELARAAISKAEEGR